MFWADRIAKDIQDTRTIDSALLVRDEKTMSGRVHIGSMRGVAIHGIISEVLSEEGVTNEYRFEFNDFDPFDSIPKYLDTKVFSEHLGKPLYAVPSPESGFENYPEYYASEFIEVHRKAGFYPSYYRAYADLYKVGKMNDQIRTALSRAKDIRRVIKEVSGSEKNESWLPVSVVCEKCGKIMTTNAFDYDGKTVAYACEKRTDEIQSCGYKGRISPLDGNAKLFWKADWAAKWPAMGVAIEGGGKDHSTKGGSRDVANHISQEVFSYKPPFDIPYEFFLVGGKKMSSSKGHGSSAKDILDLFPPEVFRLALIGKDIKEQVNFDPEGDSVPRWYDWYDDLAEGVRNGGDDDYARLYALCQLPEARAELRSPWIMRFRDVAFIVQMPHMDLLKEAERAKGSSLSKEEINKIEERAEYARFWLATYAPAQFRYELQETRPAYALSDTQVKACNLLADFIETNERSGEEIHTFLHDLKTEVPIAPKELFTAIYQLFLARDSGPKAGWFLSVLPRDFVATRLRETEKK